MEFGHTYVCMFNSDVSIISTLLHTIQKQPNDIIFTPIFLMKNKINVGQAWTMNLRRIRRVYSVQCTF